GERHQVLAHAAGTAKTRHPTLERATHQELPELPLNELGEPDAVPHLCGCAQQHLQMLADDLVEHSVLSVSRSIHDLGTGHATGYRTRNGAPMPLDGYR